MRVSRDKVAACKSFTAGRNANGQADREDLEKVQSEIMNRMGNGKDC